MNSYWKSTKNLLTWGKIEHSATSWIDLISTSLNYLKKNENILFTFILLVQYYNLSQATSAYILAHKYTFSITLLDYALDTLNWLTPSFLKKNLPQNIHVETNTQSSTFW